MQMIPSSKPMRAGLVSRLAIGAAFALGAIAAGTTPALAAKEKPAKQAPLKLSPEFQKAAGPVQKALEDAKAKTGDPLTAEKAQVEQLFTIATTPDDKLVAGQFAVSLGGMAKDPVLQRKGINAMLESGKAAPADVPKLSFYAGQLAYQAKDYAAARTALEAAIKGGYTENDPQTLLAEIYMAEGNAPQGLAMLQQSIDKYKASGQAAPEAYYRRGLLAAYKVKSGQQASGFASGLVQNYPTPENWGIAITIIREIGGIPGQDMVDLLRLMGRTNSYAEPRDYLEYIEAANPARLPGEVLKIIEVGGTNKYKQT
jgi:tetratricopeptide (TPR) repeat protein